MNYTIMAKPLRNTHEGGPHRFFDGVLSKSRFTLLLASGFYVGGYLARLLATIGRCPLHCVNLITALRVTCQALLDVVNVLTSNP